MQLAVRLPDVPKSAVKTACGLDLGLTHLATLDTGERVPNLRAGRDMEAVLRRRQRHLSRCRRGSAGRRKAVRSVGRAYAKVANRRLTHCRQQAARLVERFDLVAMEDLNVRGLARSGLAKSVHDVAWSTFAKAVSDKAESAGRHAVCVDPRGTTRDCAACGVQVPKTLSERVHRCPSCGWETDRDVNAAQNVLHRAVVGPDGRNVIQWDERGRDECQDAT